MLEHPISLAEDTPSTLVARLWCYVGRAFRVYNENWFPGTGTQIECDHRRKLRGAPCSEVGGTP